MRRGSFLLPCQPGWLSLAGHLSLVTCLPLAIQLTLPISQKACIGAGHSKGTCSCSVIKLTA